MARILTMIADSTPESPAERATHAALLTVADFYIAIQQTSSASELLKIHRLIEQALASMNAVSSAALDRADRLCVTQEAVCLVSDADYRAHFVSKE